MKPREEVVVNAVREEEEDEPMESNLDETMNIEDIGRTTIGVRSTDEHAERVKGSRRVRFEDDGSSGAESDT